MTDRLDAFLEREAGRPWSWGERDCCLFAADWIYELTGIDGAVKWRGRYHTRIGCWRVLRRDGGISAVLQQGARAAGLRATQQPLRGAIGLLPMVTTEGRLPTAGICLCDGAWVLRGAAGLHFTPSLQLAAWEV